MKKILHIIQSLTGGGAARETVYLARQSAETSDFEHEIITLRKSNDTGIKLARKYNVPFMDAPVKELLDQKMREADIIQIGWWNNPEITEFLYKYMHESRMIIRYHVAGDRPPHIILKEHLEMADKNIISMVNLPVLLEYDKSWLDTRVCHILHGTDFDCLNNIPKKQHDSFNVGYIGTVSNVKMHPEYITMSENINIPDAKFIIYGNVSDQELFQRARKSRCSYKFDFRGYTEDIGAAISEFDVFGYPLCSDTYASTDLVLQEVMHAGIPAIVFPYGGLLQTVKNGFNGLVVNNSQEYAEAIEFLWKNDAERRRMGENAKDYVNKNLGIVNTTKKYNKIYNDLLKQEKRLHSWGKDSHKPLLEQNIAFEDIIGSPPELKISKLYIKSLGIHAKYMMISMDDTLPSQTLFDADMEISKASDVFFRSGILGYHAYDANDCYLNFWAGLIYFRRSKVEQAVVHFLKAHEFKFNHWRLYWYLGNALRDAGHKAESMTVINYLARIKPDYKNKIPQSPSWATEEKASSSASKFIQKNSVPGLPSQKRTVNSTPKKMYSDIQRHLNQKSNKDIISLYEELIKIHPDFSTAYNDLGVLYYRTGDYTNALFYYSKATKLEPDNLTFQKNLADFYYVELGQVEEALEIYNKILETDPNDIETLIALAKICNDLRRDEDARCFYDRILALDASNQIAHNGLKDLKNRNRQLALSGCRGSEACHLNSFDNNYLVSAIVSCYNSEEFIRGRLEDLEAQTIAHRLEIIIIDSGSSQNERAIVDDFKQRYSNIRYIRTDNRETIYAAWNRGAQAASGKYLVNANTDDRLRSNALEVMAKTLEENPTAGVVYIDQIVTHYSNETFNHHHTTGFLKRSEANKANIVQFNPCGPQVMWRRALHDKIGYFRSDYEVAGDWDFWLRVAFETNYSILHIPELLGLYYNNRVGLEHGPRKQKERLREINSIREKYGRFYQTGNKHLESECLSQVCTKTNSNVKTTGTKSFEPNHSNEKKNQNVLLTTSAAPSQTPFSTFEKRAPIGIGFLISVLRDAGHHVFFIDNYLKPSDFLETNYLQANEIQFVGIYANTICYRDTLRMLHKLEWMRQTGQWSGKIIIGGPHTTVCLDTIPDFVDFVVQGEGEKAILDIVEGKVHERVVKYPRIKNLDELPMPAWDYFIDMPYDWGGDFFAEGPVFSMNTSRGCPFSCQFCSVKSIWGKRYTHFSAERIVDDIEHLVSTYGAKGIYFREDNFTLNRKRLIKFCELIIERGINISWACETRVNTLDEETVALMAKAGACGFYFGVESGSQKILDLLKKNIKVEDTRKAFRLCHKYNIKTAASIVVGVPNETEKDLRKTFALVEEIKPTVTWYNVFVGIPNSELYVHTLKNNLYEYIDDRGLVYLKGHNHRVQAFYKGKWDAQVPFFNINQPKISVVMSVFNGEDYVESAIKSILSQTHADFEFIIVNDASTDRTAEILNKFNDPRIKIITNPVNLGLTQSLNKAISVSKGEFIARMDADDLSLPHRFETQIGFFEQHPDYALVGSSFYKINENGTITKLINLLSEAEDIKIGLKMQNWFGHGSVMMRRDVFLDMGGYNPKFKYSQDYDLWLRISEKYKIANIKEPLYHWRLTANSISVKKEKEQRGYAQLAIAEAIKREKKAGAAYHIASTEGLNPNTELTHLSSHSAAQKSNKRMPVNARIVLYALRELHLPVLLPVYRELSKMAVGEIGFMAPPYRDSDDVAFQEGLSKETIKGLEDEGIHFWGHEPEETFDCVVIADVCYDRVDGWGPIVCIGHGTISKGVFFTKNPVCRRENFATVLCVPGPWYKESFGNQVFTHIEPTGFSKMDELAVNSSSETVQLLENMGFDRSKKTILFAPTFNPELTAMGILKDEWTRLDPEKYQVIFKLHGAAHQQIKNDYRTLAATQSNFYYVNEPDIASYMHACDILVSDVSSVYVEFFALGKPIILVNNPDMHKYPWYDPQNIEYQVRDAAYQIEKADELHAILEKLEHSDELTQRRKEYSERLFPPLDGQNSNRIAAQIVKVASGEIQSNPFSDKTINVYLSPFIKNFKQVEKNLDRTCSPVNIFSHGNNIGKIGSFSVKPLEDDQMPPTPLICMTGEHVFPHQWDYLWFLIDHFNTTAGIFGPLLKNKLDDRYLQNGPMPDSVVKMIQKRLQAHHKVHKSILGQVHPAHALNPDGMIITDGIDRKLARNLIEKVRASAENEIPSEDIRAAGYNAGVFEGFYCYSASEDSAENEEKIAVLTSQLKSRPGNASVAAELKSLLLSPRPMLSASQCPKLVSIIIPYYQQQDTIEKTLISVCNQTYRNFEVIFVNDGSDDEKAVLEILQTVAQQYPEVKINYHYKENTGLADTRNYGIRQAAGDYILPLDSDDLIAANFIEKTVSVLNQNPSVSFVYTEVLFWGAKNEIWGTIDFDPKVLLSQNLMTCTTLFRKKMWEDIGGYDLNMEYGYEDWNFWISAVERGFVGTNIREPLFLYRRKKNSMLENRVHYDPLAKEQIVRNHPSLYNELTPETLNWLKQYIGIIPPQLVRNSQLKDTQPENEHSVRPARLTERKQFKSQESHKLLFVCHDFPPYKYAGAQLYACNLARELKLKGYDVRIFHPVDISVRKPDESKTLYDLVESNYEGLQVYQINIDEKNNPSSFWNFYHPEIEEKFKELLLRENFDLVHFHLLYRLSSSLPMITKELGIPSVCTLHDYWLLCPLGHMVDSKMGACNGPESAEKCAHCVGVFNRSPEADRVAYFKNRLKKNRDTYEQIDYKISPSNFLAETHVQFGYSEPHVLPLGWLPIPGQTNRKVDKTVVFGYCGQIISRKGLDILVNAISRLNHNNWELKIYGEGYDPAYLNAILEQIKNNDQIEYKGKFTTEDLPRIYSEIDVAVIPSRRENYPLTLLEALSAKVPVVASDVGGVREMITDRVQGFIYQKDDVEGLKRILSRLAHNPQMINELQTNIEPIKTIKENSAEMDQIYKSVFDKVKSTESEQPLQNNSSLQAVILAAGRGSRLGDTNGDKPKCMVEVGHETIIERQIRALQAVGVEEIYVVVGYQQELVKKLIEEKFENVKFVENDIYGSTNTIYSLYLAIPFLKNDFFYLNGDVLFRKELLEKLMAENGSGMAVEVKECGDEEVKVKLDGRRITSISKKVSLDESVGEFIGVGLFRKDVQAAFFRNLKHEVEQNKIINDYFEHALDKAAQEVELISVDITGEPVIEIDFPKDLEDARRLARQIDADMETHARSIQEVSKESMEKLTSIIMLTRNQIEYTQQCIDSLFKHTHRPFELIIVDNGSNDGTLEYLESEVLTRQATTRIEVIKNKTNQGFAAGNNQGMAAAKGDYILLLNNDIVVTPDWMDRLIVCAEQRPEIGIVGPRSNCVSGPQVIEDVSYDARTLQNLDAFAAEIAIQNAGQAQQVLRVVGFCMLIKRAVIDIIGGMDDRYGLGNFEDDDFSLRAAIAGFESWIAMDCFIHHFGSRTFVGENIDYRKSLFKNWEIFKTKWGLPQDLPYGSPYRLTQMKNTTFDHSVHHYALDIATAATNKSDDDESAESLYAAIHAQLSTRSAEEIIVELQNLIASYPEFAVAYNDLGVLYYNAGHKEKALDFYEKAVQLAPENVNFNKNLADFYYVETGRVEDALRIYVKILDMNREDIETLLITGHICVALEKFEDAKVFYRRILEIQPDHQDALQFLDKLNSIKETQIGAKTPQELYQEIEPLLNNGDPHRAIASLEKLLESFPDFGLAHNDLGVLYYHTGDKEKTQYHYERAVELMPDNINMKKNLADFYCLERGRVEDALQIYVNILKTDPQDVETLMATGQICKALGKPDDGRDFFNQVLQIEPWNAEARRQLEEIEKQPAEASLNSESLQDAYRRLRQKLNTSSPAEAIAEFEKLIECYPDFAIGHNDLGVLYYNTGDKGKALQHYRQAADLQPGNITLLKNLADFLFIELKKVEEALEIYVKILALDPNDVETLLITGHICVALKKFDDAKGFYKKVLALDPDNEDAGRNLNTLTGRQNDRPSAKVDFSNQKTIASTRVESTDLDVHEFENRFIEPKTGVSIVVELDGVQNRVKECVKSIQTHTVEPYELLFFDRGATKGMLKWAQQLAKDNRNCDIIQCNGQAGWAESINQAIRIAKNDLIVLLHNDTVVSENWLTGLKNCTDLDPNTGVVGPMSNRAAGIQRMIRSDESERIEFESAAKSFCEQNQYRRVTTRKISDFCVAFRRDLVERIGSFDDQFFSEEVGVEDFCNRAAAKGYQNLIAADTYIYHYDRHPVKKSTSNKKPLSTDDRKKYREKWNNSQIPEAKDFQTFQYISRSNELSQRGQIDAAVETVLSAIGVQPEDKRLYMALAEILLAARRFQDVKDTLMEMPSADDPPEVRQTELRAYAEEGLQNYEAASLYIEQVLAIHSDRAPALNLKGILAHHNNDRHSAEIYFKQAIDADPGYGESYSNLAVLHLENRRPQDAIPLFEKAFRLAPTDFDVATNYHTAIAETGGYENAENVVREASCLYPANQKINYMLIDILVQQGKYETAMSQIEDAILKFGIDDGILAAALKVREKLGAVTIKTSQKKPTVSCCMIVKDEEKYLARCLASVKPIVDEIILVDTGSQDRSKDIAATFGAQVYDYEWANDFAAARNFSISKAAGDWTFILDGDEVISALDYDDFNKIVSKKPKAPVAYTITTRNYNRLANILGWVPNDGAYPDEETAIGWLPSDKVRLFYGKDQIWFEGAVHELVDPVLKRKGIEIKKCRIPVHHYGRLDQVKLDRKGEIYFEIGEKKLSEMGDDVNALRELAIQATILERNQEALDLWRRLLALNPVPELAAIAYVNMGTIYCRLEQFKDALDVSKKAAAYDPNLKEAQYNCAMAELHCGNAPATIDILENLLRGFPDYPPARFILSAAYCCVNQKEKGLERLRNLKNTPVGIHLSFPCLELGQSLVAAKQNRYALAVLGAAIECDIVNKEILGLFAECMKMNDEARQLPDIPLTMATDRPSMNFENIPR